MAVEVIDDELKDLCARADEVNRRNLETIISDNVNTEFGKKYGFADIKSMEAYRDNIPLLDYDDYEEDIDRMRKGETNVLTVYPPVTFCCTSGTTGASKFIPISQKALDRYSDRFERYKNNMLRERGAIRFLINSFRTDLSKPLADVCLFSEVYFRFMYEHGFMPMDTFIGGRDMIFVFGEEDILYAKVWEALAHDDFILLESQFLYELLNFFSYIEENWKVILGNMREKKIPENIAISEHIRNYLLSIEIPEERFALIERECSEGFDGIAKRLWPKLEMICGVGNRMYLTEGAGLRRYLGDVQRHHLCYCASECYIGTPAALNDFGYVMLPQNAFYEFLPCKGDGETRLPHELTVGEMYEPVITNFSGLYRYCMGDVVKVTGYLDKSPILEFMYRKGQALNIAGEKYDTRQLEQAVFNLRNEGITVENYCFGACLETIPGKYVVAMSLAKNKSLPGITEQKIAELLDKSLRECNHDYDDLRGLKQLEIPRVILCDINEYSEFTTATGLNKRHGHNKPKHIFKGEVSEEKWEKIIRSVR